MSRLIGFKAALVGGAVGLLFAPSSYALVVQNPTFDFPLDLTDGTSTTATGWTMTASGEPATAGNRAAFYAPTPSGGRWSFWLQDFEISGGATQVVPGVVAGTNYQFTAQMLFELGSGTTEGVADGYNAIPGENSFLSMQYENAGGNPVGSAFVTNIPSGSVPLSGDRTFNPYSVTGVAPAGATQMLIDIGWTGGAGDGGTGSQSAFATSITVNPAVPEPASLSILAIGGLSLLARRRTGKIA